MGNPHFDNSPIELEREIRNQTLGVNQMPVVFYQTQ